MFWIFALLIMACILGIYLSYGEWEFLGVIIATIAGLILFFTIIILPMHYYKEISNIQGYHAIKSTIESSRQENMSELERATLVIKITETNSWLARTRYWNNTIFDIYIPDEIMELEFLK